MKFALMAIDPGWSGGLAALFCDGREEEIVVAAMPDTAKGIWDLVSDWESRAAVCCGGNISAGIERVAPRSSQGVKSVWTFSQNYAMVQMALTAAGIERYDLIESTAWQKRLDCKFKPPKLVRLMSKAELGKWRTLKKNLTKQRAQDFYPEFKITHAVAEALLMLEYKRLTSRWKTPGT